MPNSTVTRKVRRSRRKTERDLGLVLLALQIVKVLLELLK